MAPRGRRLATSFASNLAPQPFRIFLRPTGPAGGAFFVGTVRSAGAGLWLSARANLAGMTSHHRLLQPLVRDRRDAELRPASWEEALDRVASGLGTTVDQFGPRSFGLFSCSKSTNEVNFVAGKFARAVIGSNNVDSCNRT